MKVCTYGQATVTDYIWQYSKPLYDQFSGRGISRIIYI